MDFFKSNKCDVMISKGYITLQGRKIECFSLIEATENKCCKIWVLDKYNCPTRIWNDYPLFSHWVQGEIKDCIIEYEPKFIEQSGLLVAKVLDSEFEPMGVVNVTKKENVWFIGT